VCSMKAPEEVAPLKELRIFKVLAKAFANEFVYVVDKLNELVEQLMLLDYFIPIIKVRYTVEENNPWGE